MVNKRKYRFIGSAVGFIYPLMLFACLFFALAGCQNKSLITPTEISTNAVTSAPQLLATIAATHTATQLTSTSTSTASPEPTPTIAPTIEARFSFVVNGDTASHAGSGEMDTSQYFRGMAESIAALPDVRFLITAGDTTPPGDTRWTMDQYLGKDFLWFPAVGNHELNFADLNWLHEYNYDPNGSEEPNLVNKGPSGCEETTYSFDYLNAHFAVINVYCDVGDEMRTDGAIVDHLYEWLKADLETTQKEHIFVIGHEPAYPQPDASAGIIRHEGDSLDKYPVTRDRFWSLLKQYHVTAYITGHTHSYSVVNIDGVWQVDTAHSMGARTQSTRSTYIVFQVLGSTVSYDAYRVNNLTDQYELVDSGFLAQ